MAMVIWATMDITQVLLSYIGAAREVIMRQDFDPIN